MIIVHVTLTKAFNTDIALAVITFSLAFLLQFILQMQGID